MKKSTVGGILLGAGVSLAALLLYLKYKATSNLKTVLFDHFDAINPAIWMKGNWVSETRRISPENVGSGYSTAIFACPGLLDGGQIFTINKYSYGRFTARFKTESVPSPGNAASCHAFYMYERSGMYSDEIDIEIYSGTGYPAGPSYAHFVIWKDGGRMATHIHPLGFDSSQAFHTYGWDWVKDKVTFYVDGVAVWSYVATQYAGVPERPMSICFSCYNNVWHGDYIAPVKMEVDYVEAKIYV